MKALNQKAQISFDLMLSIVFAIIFFGALGILSTEAIALEKETAIRLQLKTIALDIEEIISSSRALNESSAVFELNYSPPMISEAGKNQKNGCTITIGSETISVKSAGYTETAHFVMPSGIAISANPKCGEKIKISKP